jgi:spermidine synthase
MEQSDTFIRSRRGARLFTYYLVATAMICGALVMVVEVLGSRVLGPFFGVSLFVWTSLITVTLVALAAGYAAGGILSDRKGDAAYLYGIILAAGILVLLIPALKPIVLRACLPLGLRMGALVSALLLFGPSLFLLGCVSPYIVKLAAREMNSIGRTVGLFYALSTLGSFAGTLLTGFVLIAYLGVNRIFEVTGLVLAGLGLLYFFLFKKKAAAPLLLAAPLALLFQAPVPVTKIMANGTTVTEVFSEDSFYGNVKVVDYSYGRAHTRELMIDGLIQGGMDMNNRLSVYEYAYLLEMLPYQINPAGRNCLVIGLGAGLVPMWFEQQGIRTDVVDIDPVVVDVARRFFDFRISGDIILSDARHYLVTARRSYDYVVLDVFNGDTTPGHILSREALELVRERMTERGVLAINLIGSLGGNNLMTASVVKTLRSVFGQVEIYEAGSGKDKNGYGNLAIMAYSFAPVPRQPAGAGNFPVHVMAREGVEHAFTGPVQEPLHASAFVLSDDYNPIDFFDSALKEEVRRDILKNTDWDILI